MNRWAVLRVVRRIVPWLLVVNVAAYLLTGFGISHYHTVETITFGLLSKYLANRIHLELWIPFVVLLALHISLALLFRRKKRAAD